MALYHRGPAGGRGTGASIRIPIYVLMLMHFASRSCSLAPSLRLLARRPLRAAQTTFIHGIITIWQVKFARKERKSTKKTPAKQKRKGKVFIRISLFSLFSTLFPLRLFISLLFVRYLSLPPVFHSLGAFFPRSPPTQFFSTDLHVDSGRCEIGKFCENE